MTAAAPDPVRLDLALIRLHPELSRRKAREAIEKGQVDLGGQTVREAGHAVADSGEVRWHPNRKAQRRARLSLPLLYADEALLILDKPPGLLSVPSSPDAHDEDTALARVMDYARHLTPHRPFAAQVHRLDRDTSGALAFALTPAARTALRALFREHRIERRYAALVEGTPREDKGLEDLPLHDEYEGGRRRVARPGEPSRPALTRWSVVERFAGGALLEVVLETGRQHQIRVHLAHAGLPVIGDRVYRGAWAAPALRSAPRQMLHARLLAFAHPLTGAAVRVLSPLPEDFRKALATLRRGAARRPPAHRRPRP